MGFQQGLSGLNGASKALEAIGNNVANAGTAGFKSAGIQFGDVFAASLSGGGAAQVGIGVQVGNVAQVFTQGSITVSNSPLDMAINGGGFFRMNQNGARGTSCPFRAAINNFSAIINLINIYIKVVSGSRRGV